MPLPKVKVDPHAAPYPGKLPVRTRTPPPAPRRGLLSKPERAPSMAERHPGPKPPERTRAPVPPAVQMRESEAAKKSVKELYPGPKLPERTRPPEPPTKSRRGSVKSEKSLKERYPGPKLPERTRPPVPQPASRTNSVKKVLSVLGGSSRNSSTSDVSLKPGTRGRQGSDARDDTGSGHFRNGGPRRRVSWYGFRASPSSNNSLCDLSVCDQDCGARHEGAPSFVSARSHRESSFSGQTARSGPESMADSSRLSPYGNGYANGGGPQYSADRLVHDQQEQGYDVQGVTSGMSGLSGLGEGLPKASLSIGSLPPVMESRTYDSNLARSRGQIRHPVSLAPIVQEDITVTLWARDGDKRDSLHGSIPYETESESEPEEEPSVTLFPRGNSRNSHAPSVIISEHGYNAAFAQSESHLSKRSRMSTGSGYSTAMSGYSFATALSEQPSQPSSPRSPSLCTPSSAGTDGFGNYNSFGPGPLPTSYNQFAGSSYTEFGAQNGSANGHPITARQYVASSGRQRPSSWHVYAASNDTFGINARSAKYLSPPDMASYTEDDDGIPPVPPIPAVLPPPKIPPAPPIMGFRSRQEYSVPWGEARRGKPF